MIFINTGVGAVIRVPMKPRFMSASSVEFSRSINYFGGALPGIL